MILIIEPFGKADKVRNSSWFLLDGSFFVMIGNEVKIISKGKCGSPEEESINPPAKGVSVLFLMKKILLS